MSRPSKFLFQLLPGCIQSTDTLLGSIVYTRWDPKALYDPKKTYRIYERADSVFVLEDETWKMKYSLITNLAPKVESPYFGNDVGNVRNGSHHYYY